jgi:hypothetical protein
MELREYMNLSREERLNEVGSELPCPLCEKPRVTRSDYIRCNPCGVNWLDEEMHLPDYLNRDPRLSRAEYARTVTAIKGTAEQSKVDVDDFVMPKA